MDKLPTLGSLIGCERTWPIGRRSPVDRPRRVTADSRDPGAGIATHAVIYSKFGFRDLLIFDKVLEPRC